MHQGSSELELGGLKDDQNTTTGQSLVSAFDPEIALLYFDILTRKPIKLDFDVFISNVDLYPSLV